MEKKEEKKMNVTITEIKKMAQEAFAAKFGFPPRMQDITIKETSGRETFFILVDLGEVMYCCKGLIDTTGKLNVIDDLWTAE